MKKVVLAVLIALAVTMAISAQSYVVQEVTGRVEREAAGGTWETIKVGDTLKADAVVRTVIGARLKVKAGDEILVVGPTKNGKLIDLVGSASVIQVSGKVAETDTSAVSRRTARSSTASARASSAAADIEVEE